MRFERQFAAGWRAALNATDLAQIATALRASGLTPQSCRSLLDAKRLAEQLIQAADKAFERLRFAVEFFDIGQQHHQQIIQSWDLAGKPPLHEYAPYAAFILTIEVFFISP